LLSNRKKIEETDFMNDFSQSQKKQIRETSLKLKGIMGHPAYPFLLKTFREIIIRLEITNNDSDADNCDANLAITCSKRSYTVNLLTAFNNRIDTIIRDNTVTAKRVSGKQD
jgi:hypothetical protein